MAGSEEMRGTIVCEGVWPRERWGFSRSIWSVPSEPPCRLTRTDFLSGIKRATATARTTISDPNTNGGPGIIWSQKPCKNHISFSHGKTMTAKPSYFRSIYMILDPLRWNFNRDVSTALVMKWTVNIDLLIQINVEQVKYYAEYSWSKTITQSSDTCYHPLR
jgi:hypothetical protein